ncbi:hypothetical protein TsFJ059_008635 [Trichoderma semiorbis]|uniref:Uncharacterized protein n=1 Tax=Trichoderma semiorbis TaxID=1491008 RepID=A0A9P8HAY1_9HYPO|nr:hypothetical protein TsFJ059_008635 [Trichoderma semiorbis]
MATLLLQVVLPSDDDLHRGYSIAAVVRRCNQCDALGSLFSLNIKLPASDMLELEPAHPSTLGQQARSPPGEELNGMIRWSAKATAHFFVAFQADGDKGEAEARIWTKLHSSPTITLPCLLAQTISNKSSSNKHAPIDFNNKH